MDDNSVLAEEISKFDGDFAFLIGNGINKYMSGAVSWNEFLIYLIKDKKLQLPESVIKTLENSESKPYLTFPEIFSLANIAWKNQKSEKEKSLKRYTAEFFSDPLRPCKLLEYAARTHKNIITTNYDFNIEKRLKIKESPAKIPSISGISKKSYYYYLFEYFSAPDSAKVWHIHGHLKKPGSIKIGLEDYSNTFNYIKKNLFSDGKEHYNPAHGEKWLGWESCLGPLMSKPLVIAGCGLQSEELLLRQLLLYKFHARNTKKSERKDFSAGIYLSGPEKDKNKKAFLESLGFYFIEFENYSDIYNNKIWDQLSN